MDVGTVWSSWSDRSRFSGVFSASDAGGVVFEQCQGYRNIAERLPNERNTAFGIASGTKLFTGLAALRLIEAGKLSLTDRLWDIMPHDLGRINRAVTVRHLLTHTSGIGDYIDEESPNSVEQMHTLYSRCPVYLWDDLEYYLPMITPLEQKYEPGARFGYSNAGFVLLGLAIEAAACMPYQQYVTDTLITPLDMHHTGFYRMDTLPGNTALGYMDVDANPPRTNIFNMPIRGGADGGLFTCASDLDILWRALFAGRVLKEYTLKAFLAAQVSRGGGESYGLGVYRFDNGGKTAYYAVGGDFGVAFFTVHFPSHGITASTLGNTELNPYPLLEGLLKAI